MTRVSLFNSPLLLGFEHIERMLEQAAKSPNEGYPPYNIEHVSPDHLQITLAVAGFRESDLSVDIRDNQLIISGHQSDDEARTYLHRGIAARQFQRQFLLAEGIEVTGADLADGLLNINLHKPQQSQVERSIEIQKR